MLDVKLANVDVNDARMTSASTLEGSEPATSGSPPLPSGVDFQEATKMDSNNGTVAPETEPEISPKPEKASTPQNGETKSVDDSSQAEGAAESAAQPENTSPSKSETFSAKSSVDDHAADLIMKQVNSFDKEIRMRLHNKNIRQIDEAELAQFLTDHGFGSFVDAQTSEAATEEVAVSNPQSNGVASGSSAPPMVANSTNHHPSEQLRSSFSPPDSIPVQQQVLEQPMYNFGPTATGNGLGLHGPAAFATSPMMPQEVTADAGMPIYPNMAPNPYMAIVPPQQVLYSAFPPAGLSPYHRPHASYFPHFAPPVDPQLPQVSDQITPEMAAALLKKLQLQNPQLLEQLISTKESLPEQPPPKDQPAASVLPPSLPAPPPPGSTVHRQPANFDNSRKQSTESTSARRQEADNSWASAPSREDQPSTSENKENGSSDSSEPVWVMRETFVKRMQREEQRSRELIERENGLEPAAEEIEKTNAPEEFNEEEETDKLLKKDSSTDVVDEACRQKKQSKKEVMVHEPAVLIEGVLFRARYLGSTQMSTDGRATKSSRMAQAQEAVARVKSPDGDPQPSTEIDLFISTEKIMVLNTDLQRISETDVRQDILMDHALRSVSYIADIGDLVVLMARRVPTSGNGSDDEDSENIRRQPRLICHVFESEEASFIVQSIGQAFQVAYIEFLRANGIDDPACLREIDYQEVLNSQELMGEELEMFARKETQKDVVVPKKVGEPLGIVVVESGWGSMLPTVVLAQLAPGGPASRSNQLNIGDQIIAINGISLVGLPLVAAQQNIKNAKSSTAVRLTVVSAPPVVEVRIKRPDTKYQLGFSVQNGVICSLLRGGIAERGGIRVGHRIIEINHQSVVAVPHERIVNMLATATGEIHMKTMPTAVFRLLTGQEVPNYI